MDDVHSRIDLVSGPSAWVVEVMSYFFTVFGAAGLGVLSLAIGVDRDGPIADVPLVFWLVCAVAAVIEVGGIIWYLRASRRERNAGYSTSLRDVSSRLAVVDWRSGLVVREPGEHSTRKQIAAARKLVRHP